uniref:Albumin 1 n=2 Tax=Clitoria ternatea TaxID=43366 RepID=A0A0S1RG88_CLITE|nr:albumin 1 [Clitoria ternatea]
MAYVKHAPLAVVFLLATSVMFIVKNAEAGGSIPCGESCVFLPCFLPGCSCKSSVCYLNHIIASDAKTVDEHHLLCQSHEDCFKKGTGNFCAAFPDHDIAYGWCFHAQSEGYLLKDFLKMPKGILKMPMEIAN